MSPYFFSDICGTLYRANTSYRFLAYYFQRNNRIKAAYFRLLLSLPAKVVWKLSGVVVDMEWLRKHLLGLLKGEKEEKVALSAKTFVREVLPGMKNTAAWEKINPDIPVVLVSATLSPVAKAIAEEMGAEAYFATQMEVVNGVFTGRIASDARNQKLEILSVSNYAPYLSSSIFMTDNKEDLPLVKVVREAIIVADVPAHQRYWLKQQLPGLTFLNH
jgi:HAD superfamily phosphoserine phosphatase-like hydrolase